MNENVGTGNLMQAVQQVWLVLAQLSDVVERSNCQLLFSDMSTVTIVHVIRQTQLQ